MRLLLVITAAVHCLSVSGAQAATLPFEQDGGAEPFYAPKIQIVWAATNPLPAEVRIFKLVPANFSPAAISNLKSLGGSANAKNGRMFVQKSAVGRSTLEKVPDKARAYALGTNLLTELEIPAAEVLSENGRPSAGFYPSTRTHRDKVTRQMITEPWTMGVRFQRVLDGIECLGQEVHLQYQSQEALTQLDIHWNGVEASKACKVATPDQIISWIKEGRARAHPVETTGSRWISVSNIRKATVRQVNLFYDASPDPEDWKKLPDYLYPYATLELEIEFSSRDRESLAISCPVIPEALSSPIRKTSEFNILPKSFHETASHAEGDE